MFFEQNLFHQIPHTKHQRTYDHNKKGAENQPLSPNQSIVISQQPEQVQRFSLL